MTARRFASAAVTAVVVLALGGLALPLSSDRTVPSATTAAFPFGPPTTPFKATGFYSTVADFNEDGIPDVAGAILTQDRASVLLGNGVGGFSAEATPTVGDQPFAAVATYLNGDSHADLVVTNRTDLSVLFGNGNGLFAPEARYPLNVDIARFPAIGDFNVDGALDVAVAVRNPYVVAVLLGNPGGTLQPAVHYPAVVGRPRSIVVADFDEDGNDDLAVGTEADNELALLRGNGDGTFAPAELLLVRAACLDLVVGDFDGDGHQDLAGSNLVGDGAVVVRGRGDGTFEPVESHPLEEYVLGLAVADFNLDGRSDLAASTSLDLFTSHALFFLAGSGNANFVPEGSTPLSSPTYFEHILATDLDSDGDPDLVLSPGAVRMFNLTGPPGVCSDADSDGYGAPGDRACPGGAATDCDDAAAARSPGAPEACNGLEDDCDGLVDEGFDADFDGWTTCGGDCADGDAAVHPHATEINDGKDNQCVGDSGFGLVDEMPGLLAVVIGPSEPEVTWPLQTGATGYEVARATQRAFAPCTSVDIAAPPFVDGTVPDSRGVLYYMVRSATPYPGSWGRNSAGLERTLACAP